MAVFNFIGANGGPVPAGLTVVSGSAEIQNNRLQTLTAPLLIHATGLPDDTVSVVCNGGGVSDSSMGLLFRFLDASNYWFAIINTTSGVVSLFRTFQGSPDEVANATITGFDNSTDYLLSVAFSGRDYTVSVDGTEVISYTHTTDLFATETKHGIRGATVAANYDNLVISASSEPDAITIAEVDRENRVFQADGNNQYTASFDVTYTGSPSSLSYRLLDASNSNVVVDWTVFDASPTDGASSVSVTRTRSTVEYLIEVRQDTSDTVTDSQTLKWSVGMLVSICGQSLARDIGSQGNSGLPTSVYKFESGNGFFNSSVGQGQAALGVALRDEYNCTVALTNTAVGGTCMTTFCGSALGQGINVWANEAASLFSNKVARLSEFAPDGRIEFELFIQGQADAVANTPASNYLDIGGTGGLDSYIIESRAVSTAKDGSDLPFIIGTLGRNTSTGNDTGAQEIRGALLSFIGSDTKIYPLTIFPLSTDDGTHPTLEGDTIIGQQTASIYIGNQSPSVTSISMSGAVLILTFNQDLQAATSYDLEGVKVVASSVDQNVSSFEQTGTREAQITLSSDPVDKTDVDVYFAYGTGSTSNILSYPIGVNGLYAKPLSSLGNDLSSTNADPIANAGGNQSIPAGATCILDGSASSDSDGAIVSYSWRKVSGPTIALANADQAVASFIAPSESTIQTLVFELTVTDDDGATSTDTATVTVAAVPDVADPLDPTLSVISIKSKVGIEDDIQSFGVVSLYQYTDNFILCEVVSKSNAALSPDSFSQAEYRIVDNKGTNVVKLGLGTGIKEADGKFLIHINSGILNSSHKGSLKHQFVVWNQAGYKLPPIFGGTVNIIPVLEPTL